MEEQWVRGSFRARMTAFMSWQPKVPHDHKPIVTSAMRFSIWMELRGIAKFHGLLVASVSKAREGEITLFCGFEQVAAQQGGGGGDTGSNEAAN